jgi:hypothetical protein
MTTAFKELAGSPREVFTTEGMRAQRRLLVLWADRRALITELLGNGAEFGGVLSAQYPDYEPVVVDRIQVRPWNPSPDEQGAFTDVESDLNAYTGQYAEITVDYELLPPIKRPDPEMLPSTEPDTFLTYRSDHGAEAIQIPGHTLKWTDQEAEPVPAEVVGVKRIPTTEHTLTWHRVMNPPWTAIRELKGLVNHDTFLGAPKECVLFEGAQAQSEFMGFDSLDEPIYGWTITYLFRERSITTTADNGDTNTLYTWNHMWRSLPMATPAWDKLVDDQGKNIYDTADLTKLFQYEEEND